MIAAWMSCITATFAFCLFPNATVLDGRSFTSRKAIRVNDLSRIWDKQFKEKYNAFVDVNAHGTIDRESRTSTRAVGDSKSWRIYFEIDGTSVLHRTSIVFVSMCIKHSKSQSSFSFVQNSSLPGTRTYRTQSISRRLHSTSSTTRLASLLRAHL